MYLLGVAAGVLASWVVAVLFFSLEVFIQVFLMRVLRKGWFFWPCRLASLAWGGVVGGASQGGRRAGEYFIYFGAGGFPSGGGIAWCVFCDGGASPPLTLIHLDSPSRTSLCGLSSRLDRLRLRPRAPLVLGSASAGVVYGQFGCSFS